jgi:hypothetical protein
VTMRRNVVAAGVLVTIGMYLLAKGSEAIF